MSTTLTPDELSEIAGFGRSYPSVALKLKEKCQDPVTMLKMIREILAEMNETI